MPEKSPLKPAKSGRAGATLALGCAIPFGLVFICAGCAILWMMILRPFAQVAASLRWQPVEAVILSSALDTGESAKGKETYRVAVTYRYVWPPADHALKTDPPALLGAPDPSARPREYIGERYDFSSGHTNVAVADMREIIAAHPPGSRVTCYVDPHAPHSAVIDRSPPLHVWLGFGFGVFPLAGFGVIVGAWYNRRRVIAAEKARTEPDHVLGELPLKLAETRIAGFITTGFITLFWNGIVSVFVIIAFKEFGNGFIGWFLPVFLIPFVFVGLVLLVGFLHALSLLFAPTLRVWIEDAPPRLGATHRLRWRLDGSGVRSLRIHLRVHEESTDARGAETNADQATLVDETVFDSTDASAFREGLLSLPLPDAGLPPSIDAPNNRLRWELVFEGRIPRRAALEDHFILPVNAPSVPATPPPPHAVAEHAGQGIKLWTAERFAPGDTLAFTVKRYADSRPGPLTVRLGWFTKGRTASDSAIVWSETPADFVPDSDRTFTVRLPASPWSYVGALASLEWRLEVIDRKKHPLVAVRLVVAPGGEPMILRPPLPKPDPSKTPWWRWRSPRQNSR